MNEKQQFLPNTILSKNHISINVKSSFLASGKLLLFLGILFMSSISLGQTGPAGVNYSALRLWLDGSDPAANGTPPAAGTIGQWNDKSANGHDLNAPGGVPTDPDYIPSDPAFNGAGVLVFDSTNIFQKGVTDWTSDHTIFIVFKLDSVVYANGTAVFSSGNDGTGGGTSVDDRFEIQVESGLTNYTYHTTNSGAITESVFGAQSAALALPVMYSATRSGNNVSCFNNGVLSSTMTPTTGGTFDEYILNANREGSAYGNNCKIAEVIIYDTVLSPTEMVRINNYLACKYGLAIAGAAPGGIDPCDVALWMKADEGVGTTGSDVDLWEDQSPNSFNGTPANSGEEPFLNPMDNNFNPSLTFNSANSDALSLGTAADDGLRMGSGAFSLYSVAFVNDATDGVLFSDRLCFDENGYLLQFNSFTKEWEFEAGAGSNGSNSYTNNDSVNVKTNNTTTDYALLNIKRSALTYTAKTHEGNEGTKYTSSHLSYSYSTTPTERWIGRQYNSVCSANNFNGSISEIIAVKADLTTNEDIQIQSYLGIKYGLSLDPSIVNYLASNLYVLWDNTSASYWNDVAGIGRDDGSLLDQRISKSQHSTGIVTISNDLDFISPNNAGTRTSFTDGQFLMWGNNDVIASGGWTTTGAPSGYAVLPEAWLVQETNSPGAVSIQVNVDNLDNNIPIFHGDLYLAYGVNPAALAPTVMTLDSVGYWSVTGIDFADNDLFTFAVKNELFVEFTSSFSNSTNETILGAGFASVVDSGIVNVATSYIITTSGTGVGTGFATLGVDFTHTDQTVPVAPGDYSTPSTNALNPLPVLVDDSAIEGAEVVEFSFIVSDGVVTGDANNSGGIEDQHNLTITDDDAHNLKIEKVSDGDEGGPLDASFVVYLDGGWGSSTPTVISGDITYSGTAAGLADPTPDFNDGVVSFSFGPGAADTLQIIYLGTSAYNDSLLEGTETIIGTISNVSALSSDQVVIAIATDTAFVSDDEVTGILVSIDTVNNLGTTEEGGTTLSFRISLANGVTNNSGSSIDGTIDYSGSTATPGGSDDFIPVTSFSILDGNNSTTITVNALSDILVENTETVVPEITLTNGIGTVNPTGNTATGYITDEDTTGLTISIAVVGGLTGVTEGNVATIDYVVSLDNSKVNGTGVDITGTVSFAGSPSATNLLDYNINGNTNFAIPDGASSGVYSITLVNDTIPETTDIITAEIVSTSIGMPSGSNIVDLNIFDDDSGNTIIEIGSPTDTTESPTGMPFVSFEISIVAGGPAAANITGVIGYGSGTGVATSGVDFTSVTGYTIIAGQLSTTIDVFVTDDFLIEPSEFVIASLTGNPSLGSYGNSSSTATIFDDEAANIGIEIDTVMSGAEGGANVQFVVGISGGLTNGTGNPIYGNIVYGGTVSGGDFSAIGNYEIANGESADTITVTVIDDNLIEFTDSIYGILTSTSIGTLFVDSALAFIYDNDFDSLSISIQTPVDGAEGGTDVSFTILIDDGYVNGLGVPLTGELLFTGTATAGFDFSDFDTYSIPDGSAFFIRDLPVLDDQSLEQQESVIATLSNPFIMGSHNPNLITDTAYIDDDDLANAQLEIVSTRSGVEIPIGSANGIFTIGIVGGLQNQTGIPITGNVTYTGTAIDGTDYTATTTFSILNDSTVALLNIFVDDDLLEEPTETVIATISSLDMGLSVDSSASLNILDDETDTDHDGLPDLLDPDNDIYGSGIWNIDSDCDGIFDGCDVDADGDGINDDGGIDLNGDGIDDVYYYAAPLVDTDGDGIEDGCDADINGPDENGDGLSDLAWDPTDTDSDLLPDHVDPNDNNIDTDGDGITDGADYDINGNGVLLNGCDFDGDGIHDVADADDDGMLGTDSGNTDNDGDGIDARWDMSDIEYEGQQINYIVSPNGDGVNETLVIHGVQVIERHELIIFNRYGEPVYVNVDYNNDWAGQVNQDTVLGTDMLGDGVYYYTLDVGSGKNVVRGYIEIRK